MWIRQAVCKKIFLAISAHLISEFLCYKKASAKERIYLLTGIFIGREPMTRIPLPAGGNKAENLSDRLEMSTAEIGLSVRTTNCLEERGIFTVNDLLNCSPEDLLDISNFGEKTLEEVYSALETIGFYRRSPEVVDTP